MHPLIIDTDPGIDDAQAIAFAIAHPDIELIGLTTVFGNASIELTSRNALRMLEEFGCAHIPVAAGAHKPLIQDRYPAPDFVHGSDGIGNLNLSAPSSQLVDESAAEFIVRSANEFPQQVNLIAIGPLTNVALALQLDSELPQKLKQLIIMGGTVDEPGNVTPLAEANFINDPHAADQVLAHDWPATIIGLDVTLQTLLTDHHLAKLRDEAGIMGQFLWDSSRFYIDFYSKSFARTNQTPAVPCCAMHDASAVVYLVEPDAFQKISGPCRVIEDGLGVGQLCMDRKREPYILPHWDDRADSHAAMQVDSAKVLDTFLNTIAEHAKS